MANTLSIIIFITKELEKSVLKVCAFFPAIFRLMASTNILGKEIRSVMVDRHIISGLYLYLNLKSS